MATVPLNITAQQAQAEVAGFAKKFAKGTRRTPAELPMLKRISEENKVYIHNVGPWDHRRDCGSWGTFFIPACKEGQQFATMGAIPGIFREPYPISPDENRVDEYQGDFVASEILGTGTHTDKRNSFLQFGCFQSPNAIPTKAEIATALKALMDTALKLYRDAVSAYNKGPEHWEQFKTDRHFWAAAYTGHEDANYVKLHDVMERGKCDGCGKPADKGVMKCAHCGYILDVEKHKKAKAEGRF